MDELDDPINDKLFCLHPGMNDEYTKARVVLLTDDGSFLKRWGNKRNICGW